jgi:hypothetical protein
MRVSFLLLYQFFYQVSIPILLLYQGSYQFIFLL